MRIFFLATAAFFLAACTLPNPTPGLNLPQSSVRVFSASSAFRMYRYPIHGVQPTALAKVDAFHRGLDDIVVSNPGSSTVELFKNQGDGTFKHFAEFQTCNGGADIDGEDISGDGLDDFMVNCPNDSALALFLGDGHGGFTKRMIPVGEGSLGGKVAPHVSQPGTPYLTVLHDSPASLELLVNRGYGEFVRSRHLPIAASPSQFVAETFTPTGMISYAVTSALESKLSVFLNGGRDFSREDYPTPEAPGALAAADLHGTGIVDLVVGSSTINSFRVFLNDGRGRFSLHKDYALPGGPVASIGAAHLRGLSQAELVIEEATTGSVVFFPNLGDGALGTPEILKPGGIMTALLTGHFFHKSDDMDVALIDRTRGELVILLNEHRSY